MNLVKLLKNNHVEFHSYRAGYMYYRIKEFETEDWYIFPVPVNDVIGATLFRTDVALIFMRWIRLALENGTLIKQ